MRQLRLAGAAVLAGLVSASTFGGSVSAATIVTLSLPMNATRIVLNPTIQSHAAPGTAQLTATVADWNGKGLRGIKVTASVLEGPNARVSIKSQTTDTKGNAVLTYSGGGVPGIDVVQATFTDGLEVHKSNRPFVAWQTGSPPRAISSPATLTVSPTCFQPAIATIRASDQLRGVKSKSTPAPDVGTITVTGNDFNPFSAVLITFDAGPGGRPQNFQVSTDGFGSFSRDIQVTEPQEGIHIVRADDFREREAQATYRLPCSMGNIALDPPIGPPGFVTFVVGRNFPPGSPITFVNWTKPDLPSPFPKGNLKTNPDGSFRFPILVLYHDELGPRTLRAVVQDQIATEGNALIEADAPFFVTPGRIQPDDFVERR